MLRSPLAHIARWKTSVLGDPCVELVFWVDDPGTELLNISGPLFLCILHLLSVDAEISVYMDTSRKSLLRYFLIALHAGPLSVALNPSPK